MRASTVSAVVKPPVITDAGACRGDTPRWEAALATGPRTPHHDRGRCSRPNQRPESVAPCSSLSSNYLSSRPDLPGPDQYHLSAVQLAAPDWLSRFTGALLGHGVEPHRIVIEVTETAVLNPLDSC